MTRNWFMNKCSFTISAVFSGSFDKTSKSANFLSLCVSFLAYILNKEILQTLQKSCDYWKHYNHYNLYGNYEDNRIDIYL